MINNSTAKDGAKEIGLREETYGFIKKLLILRDRDDIPRDSRVKIEESLRLIEEHKNTGEANRLSREVVRALWEPNKRRSQRAKIKKQKTDEKIGRRLDHTLINISESCQSTLDLEIPENLSPAAVNEAVVTLSASTELIARLIQRLMSKEGEEK